MDFLILLMSKQEWSNKLKAKFRHADWDLMAKVVQVLQVRRLDLFGWFSICF